MPNNNVNKWSIDEQKLLRKIDSFRCSKGKEVLFPDKLHWELALYRNKVNDSLGFITHEGMGIATSVLLVEGLNSIGENLGIGYTSIETVFAAWLVSEGHRNNMLKTWKYVGLSIYKKDDESVYYYCTLFSK